MFIAEGRQKFVGECQFGPYKNLKNPLKSMGAFST